MIVIYWELGMCEIPLDENQRTFENKNEHSYSD